MTTLSVIKIKKTQNAGIGTTFIKKCVSLRKKLKFSLNLNLKCQSYLLIIFDLPSIHVSRENFFISLIPLLIVALPINIVEFHLKSSISQRVTG